MLMRRVEIRGSVATATGLSALYIKNECKEVDFDIITRTMAAFIYLLSCLLRPASISGCTSSESSYIWLAIKPVLPPLDA